MLQTAAVQGQVLGGIARTLIVLAARQLGLQVCEQAPNIRDAASWQEAFVCSWCVPGGCCKSEGLALTLGVSQLCRSAGDRQSVCRPRGCRLVAVSRQYHARDNSAVRETQELDAARRKPGFVTGGTATDTPASMLDHFQLARAGSACWPLWSSPHSSCMQHS